ncbi:MAG: hypothetical protein GW913_11335 [Myxococcales bacterium]|nr:hypothetical protein [Myxococcales bacterium]
MRFATPNSSSNTIAGSTPSSRADGPGTEEVDADTGEIVSVEHERS